MKMIMIMMMMMMDDILPKGFFFFFFLLWATFYSTASCLFTHIFTPTTHIIHTYLHIILLHLEEV